MTKGKAPMRTELDYGDRKLAHYNKWLLDPKREFGTLYPGFPEDLKSTKGKKMESTVVANMADVLTNGSKPAAPAKKAKRMSTRGSTPTKGELALMIYKRLSGDKQAVIGELQSDLGMSLAGATTYFYNAKKAASV
jgi:hypothetical protein